MNANLRREKEKLEKQKELTEQVIPRILLHPRAVSWNSTSR